MTDFPWLTASLLVPLVGAVVVAVLPARADGGDLHKKVALGFSLLTLVVVPVLYTYLDALGRRAKKMLARAPGVDEAQPQEAD